jgi:hypothetical protein
MRAGWLVQSEILVSGRKLAVNRDMHEMAEIALAHGGHYLAASIASGGDESITLGHHYGFEVYNK